MTTVTCRDHGPRPSAYVCGHILTGTERGFHWTSDPAAPDELCPDAWCDRCDETYRAEGGWNERSTAVADIGLLCDRCYEIARERNWRQDMPAYHRLCADATAYMNARQDALRAEFRLGEWERYDWDQETGRIVFSHNKEVRVVADVQFVGSVSTFSDTWLWAWANESFLEKVRADVRKVRAYGTDRRFLRLASARWEATEDDGWHMTAIAAFILQAQGVYRSSDERGATFMLLNDVRWSQ